MHIYMIVLSAYIYIHVCTTCMPGARRGQKNASYPLDLKL